MEHIKVKTMLVQDNFEFPVYQTSGSAGMDLRYQPKTGKPKTLQPGEIKILFTGIKLEIPEGYEAQIRSRSGLSTKGIVVANAPGTIDSDYRGEISVILQNLSKYPFTVNAGDRIAQLVFAKVEKAKLYVVEELSETKRNTGGFGSTGLL